MDDEIVFGRERNPPGFMAKANHYRKGLGRNFFSGEVIPLLSFREFITPSFEASDAGCCWSQAMERERPMACTSWELPDWSATEQGGSKEHHSFPVTFPAQVRIGIVKLHRLCPR